MHRMSVFKDGLNDPNLPPIPLPLRLSPIPSLSPSIKIMWRRPCLLPVHMVFSFVIMIIDCCSIRIQALQRRGGGRRVSAPRVLSVARRHRTMTPGWAHNAHSRPAAALWSATARSPPALCLCAGHGSAAVKYRSALPPRYIQEDPTVQSAGT